RALATGGGLKPARIAVYSDPHAQQEDPSLTLFFPLFQTALPRPITPFYLMLSQILQGEFSAAVTGIKPEALALQDAERQIRRIVALDIPEEHHAQISAE